MRNDNAGSHPASPPGAALPVPSPAFRWDQETWGPALRCAPFEACAQHVFTSRQLELPSHASLERAEHAWRLAAGSLGAGPREILRVTQVHGREVRVVRRGAVTHLAAGERPDGDAIVSDAPGLVLAVVVADCVPILLADARAGAAAAIHAGWRGTCRRVVSAAVDAMVRECGSRPEDLVAAIGPSIGPDDYEVSEALLAEFEAAGHGAAEVSRWFGRVGSGGRPSLDLWRATRDQLEAAGVRTDAIFVAGLSTASHPGCFESYRRDGSRAGRQAALVRVPGRAVERAAQVVDPAF